MSDLSEPLDRAALVRACAGGQRFKYLFFWGHTPDASGAIGPHVLSQWWPAEFEAEGSRYMSAEHFMMAEKARLFGDFEAREQILRARTPAAAKALGRRVRRFDEQRWSDARFETVVRGSIAKFGSDPALLDYLLETGNRVLVEASPRDRIWGIGMGSKSAAATDPSNWRGLNLLGFALMDARRRLSPSRL